MEPKKTYEVARKNWKRLNDNTELMEVFGGVMMRTFAIRLGHVDHDRSEYVPVGVALQMIPGATMADFFEEREWFGDEEE